MYIVLYMRMCSDLFTHISVLIYVEITGVTFLKNGQKEIK